MTNGGASFADWPRPSLAIAVATVLAVILGLAVIAFAEA